MSNKTKTQNFERGAVILLASAIIVKIIGAIFKIPLQRLIGDIGFGYFSSAYDLFLPIYTLSMAGLPIAVSRLTAACVAENRFKDTKNTLRIAKKAFLVTGLTGFIIMLGATYFYAKYTTDNNTDAKYVAVCVLMVAPTVLFCCLMSAYRGYYEGLRNMYPTAISDVIEALGKLILGFSFAYIILKITGKVAYAAAGALSGITVGTIAALLYLSLRHKIKGDTITEYSLCANQETRTSKQILKALIVIAVPIALSSIASNVTLFIDAFMVKLQLKNVMENSFDFVRDMYINSVNDYNASAQNLGRDVLTASNMPTFLYGIRGEAYVFYNLIPTLTGTFGIGSVPFLTTVWVAKDKSAIKKTIETIIRTTAVIALPAGIGMASIAPEIMGLIYDGVAPVEIGGPLLRMLGIAAVFAGLSVPMTNMLQAIGKPILPVRNIAIGASLKIIVNLLLVGRPEINIMGAPIGTLVCYVFIFVSNTLCLIKYTGTKINFYAVLVKPAIAAICCGVSAFLLSLLLSKLEVSTVITVVLCIAVAGVVYLSVIFAIKTLSKEDVQGFPKGEKIAEILEKLHLIR
ncbi:MAG: polysaccharide biosynthesis protein [Ruminococcaceae bacterium]|nr:polysaccharide biosynthesis protein [Oscillospiraceae bacterium]